MNKLNFSDKKTLKLTNVLKYKLLLSDDNLDFHTEIEKMSSYIKVKGANQIGPLIQYTNTFVNEQNEIDIEIYLMLQCNHFIHNVEPPYSMESVICIQDCMYCRFIGAEEKLKLAYDKINIEAFERDIDVSTRNYTVFVDRNEEENTMIADVFVPKEIK